MTTARRFLRFNAVGALGIGVQLATIWALTDLAGLSYIPATLAGVSLAITHNFFWHLRWTWRDRALDGSRAVRAFFSFVGANGAVSYGGNLVVMIALVSGAGFPVMLANFIAIAVCGLINFRVGDTIVFSASASRTSIPTTSR